jgi:hypothetical protein
LGFRVWRKVRVFGRKFGMDTEKRIPEEMYIIVGSAEHGENMDIIEDVMKFLWTTSPRLVSVTRPGRATAVMACTSGHVAQRRTVGGNVSCRIRLAGAGPSQYPKDVKTIALRLVPSRGRFRYFQSSLGRLKKVLES